MLCGPQYRTSSRAKSTIVSVPTANSRRCDAFRLASRFAPLGIVARSSVKVVEGLALHVPPAPGNDATGLARPHEAGPPQFSRPTRRISSWDAGCVGFMTSVSFAAEMLGGRPTKLCENVRPGQEVSKGMPLHSPVAGRHGPELAGSTAPGRKLSVTPAWMILEKLFGEITIWNEHLLSRPHRSVAVQVTVVVPIGNMLPLGGMHTTTGAGSTSSVAGTLKNTFVPVPLHR